MDFILLGTSTTSTGRGLLQEDRTLYVLSACCTAKYLNDKIVCSVCQIKDSKISGWRTTISLDEDWVEEQRHWKEWGQGVFGYKDFELHIEEK